MCDAEEQSCTSLHSGQSASVEGYVRGTIVGLVSSPRVNPPANPSHFWAPRQLCEVGLVPSLRYLPLSLSPLYINYYYRYYLVLYARLELIFRPTDCVEEWRSVEFNPCQLLSSSTLLFVALRTRTGFFSLSPLRRYFSCLFSPCLNHTTINMCISTFIINLILSLISRSN